MMQTTHKTKTFQNFTLTYKTIPMISPSFIVNVLLSCVLSCLPQCIIKPIQACANLDCAIPLRPKYLNISVNALKVRHVVQCVVASCRSAQIIPLQVQFQPTDVSSVLLFIFLGNLL